MKPDFFKLITEHNGHNTFLNPKGLVDAMEICYNSGKKDGNEEVLNWLEKMDHLSDNLTYITQEWKNQNKSEEL